MPENEFAQPIGEPVEVHRPDAPPRTVMTGTFCELHPLDASAHGAQLFDSFCDVDDDGDWTYLPYGPFLSLDHFMPWLETVQDQPDPIFFTVIDRASGGCTGLASYLRIDAYAASVEVGHIHFSRRIQGTPTTTETMYLMMRTAFDAGYRRYEWKCDDLNAPSWSAALRLGFSYEGTFKQATHYKGRNRDTAWFGIVDRDWPPLRTEFERWLETTNFDASGAQLTRLVNR
jgi:RimJ/RimL family protein N-acetyltransferase